MTTLRVPGFTGSRIGARMATRRYPAMDYFVVEFDAGPGKTFGEQIFFCESSEQKAEEIAKAWALSHQITARPEVRKMEECVFSSGRFYTKPVLADEEKMQMLSRALSAKDKKTEEPSTTPFKALGRKSSKK
jgi:hypothetical protein